MDKEIFCAKDKALINQAIGLADTKERIQAIQYVMKTGYPHETIREKHKDPTQIIYNGKVYKSKTGLCEQYGVKYSCVSAYISRHGGEFFDVFKIYLKKKEQS